MKSLRIKYRGFREAKNVQMLQVIKSFVVLGLSNAFYLICQSISPKNLNLGGATANTVSSANFMDVVMFLS